MGCCLAAALLFSLARRGWWFVTGQEPLSEPFPPAARRAAPGESLVLAVPERTETRPLISVPVACVITAVAYLATAAAIGAPGTLPRDATLAGVVLIALILGTRWRPARREGAVALAVSGGLWSVLALVDMHGFGFSSSTPVDIAVHGVGLIALYAGLLTWQPLRRLSPREGLTS